MTSEIQGHVDKAAAEGLSAETVAGWLRDNPGFLSDNLDLFISLASSGQGRDETVVNMHQYLIDRLRDEMLQMRDRESEILTTVGDNTESLVRIHRAVVAMSAAYDLESLVDTVHGMLPLLLDVEAAILCMEVPEGGVPAPPGLNVIGQGWIESLLGRDVRISLRSYTPGEPYVFGDAAERIGSVAYMRLNVDGYPPVMIAFGSSLYEWFESGQATELMAFLGDVLELRLSQCLES